MLDTANAVFKVGKSIEFLVPPVLFEIFEKLDSLKSLGLSNGAGELLWSLKNGAFE